MSGKSKTASTLTGAVSGGASGAAAGSAFGPYGAAIGGVGGALIGGIGGYMAGSADEEANANDPEEILKRRRAKQMQMMSERLGKAFAAVNARKAGPGGGSYKDMVMEHGVY